MRGGGKYRSSGVCRMSIYGEGKYAAILLTDAAFEETGFKADVPVYLHAQQNFFVITSEGKGRPFFFRKETDGKLRMSVNCAILDPIIDLSYLEGKRTQPMEVLAVENGLIKLKYPEK
jgi:hypothetical protein